MIVIIEGEGRVVLDSLDCKLLKKALYHYMSDLPINDPKELQRFQDLFSQISNIHNSIS